MTTNAHALRGTGGKVKAIFTSDVARWVGQLVIAYIAAYLVLTALYFFAFLLLGGVTA